MCKLLQIPKTKKFILLSLIVFLAGCSSVVKKEDIFVQAQQIKESAKLAEQKQTEPPTPTPSQPQNLTAVESQPPATESQAPHLWPLPSPEKLIYKVKYCGITIGEFIFNNLGRDTLSGRLVFKYELIVKTAPFFAKLFKTRDRYVSYLDAEKFVVLRREEYIQGGSVLETSVDFDYQNLIATHKNWIDSKEKTIPIPGQVFDILSGGYYLRMVPWELGDTVEVNVYFDDKIYNYVGLLHSEMSISLPGHGKQPAYLLKPYAFFEGKPVTKVSAEVFFSTTNALKTMRAVMKTKLGNVAVVLVEGFEN